MTAGGRASCAYRRFGRFGRLGWQLDEVGYELWGSPVEAGRTGADVVTWRGRAG